MQTSIEDETDSKVLLAGPVGSLWRRHPASSKAEDPQRAKSIVAAPSVLPPKMGVLRKLLSYTALVAH